MCVIVWYASGIQSVILKERHISIEFKILIVERIFIPKVQEVTGGWIKLRSIENSGCIEPRFRGVKIEKEQIGEEFNII